MMQLVSHFHIPQADFHRLTIEQYYNYLEEFSRFVDEHNQSLKSK